MYNFFNNKISFTKIILIYSFYITVVFNFFVFEKINNNLQNSTESIFLILYFYILVFLTLYFFLIIFFATFGFRFFLKPLICIFLIFSSISLHFKIYYGINANSEIILSFSDAIIEKNFTEIFDLLSLKLFMFIFFLGLIPFSPLLFIEIKYPKISKEFFIRFVVIAIILLIWVTLVAINYKNISLTARSNKIAGREAIPHYTLTSLFSVVKKGLKETESFKIIDTNPYTLNPNEEIIGVIVVGETARADRFSINNYKKNTNPLLAQKNIINYSNAESCGTLTRISVPCMFFLDNYKEFSVDKAKYQENLLDILQKTKTNILWIENNSSCKSVCKNVDKIDTITIDGSGVYDEITVQLLENIFNTEEKYKDKKTIDIHKIYEILKKIKSSNKNFHNSKIFEDKNAVSYKNFIENKNKNKIIVIHMAGSHGPKYFNRYPKKFEKFLPSCKSNNPQDCSQEELSNAFDNTILYTDFVLSKLIELLTKQEKKSFMIYASDHGESLGEMGIYLHGVPKIFAPKEQTHIPWIMWFSENYKKKFNIKLKDQQQKITHEYFPHTILEAMRIKTKVFKKDKSLISSN